MESLDEDGNYCFWDAKSDIDVAIIISNLVTVSIISSFALMQYRKTPNNIPSSLKRIYFLIFAWFVNFFCKDLFGIIVFFTVLRYDASSITIFSKIYAWWNAIPALIVQALFLQVGFMICKNVLQKLTINQIRATRNDMRLYLIVYYYRFWRYVILIMLVAQSAMPYASIANILEAIFICFCILDAIICSIIVLLCHKLFKKYRQQLQMSQKSARILQNELNIILLCSFTRIFGDLVFLVLPAFYNESQSQCIITNDNDDHHLIFSIVYILLGDYLMHFVPIASIIYMYKTKNNQGENLTSLVSSKQLDIEEHNN